MPFRLAAAGGLPGGLRAAKGIPVGWAEAAGRWLEGSGGSVAREGDGSYAAARSIAAISI